MRKNMKKWLSTVLCVGILLSPKPVLAVSDWAKEDVALAEAMQLIPAELSGKEMTDGVTRQEFCTMALLMYERITKTSAPQATNSNFTDTFDSDVNRAYELGLVGGRGNGMFMPDEVMTREEMYGLLYNLLKATGNATDLTADDAAILLAGFHDQGEIADWAVLPLGMMVELGLTNGANPGLMEPKGVPSREQAVVLSLRFTEKFSAFPQQVTVASQPEEVMPEQNITLASRGDTEGVVLVEMASAMEDQRQKFQRIYGDKLNEYQASLPHYPSEEQAAADMVTITVPAWDISGGQWVSKSYNIVVHKNLAATYQQIFTEIYNLPEKFPIHDIGCYAWRSGTSGHSSGTAIDINANENPQMRNDGTILVGVAYEPGVNPYSIVEDGPVVEIFARYGFKWGGNAWFSS